MAGMLAVFAESECDILREKSQGGNRSRARAGQAAQATADGNKETGTNQKTKRAGNEQLPDRTKIKNRQKFCDSIIKKNTR